MIYQTLKYS